MAAEMNGHQAFPSPPRQLSFTIPTSPDTKLHLLTYNLAHCLFLTLTTATTGAPSGVANLGNLIYALPDRLNPTAQPISTALYTRTTSVDFVTRLAKILAKRLDKPVYAGGEVKFWVQEDEGIALRGCVDVVIADLEGPNSS